MFLLAYKNIYNRIFFFFCNCKHAQFFLVVLQNINKGYYLVERVKLSRRSKIRFEFQSREVV